MAYSEKQVRAEIFTLHPYHPYRIHGEKNPKFDDDSRRILNLKNEKDGKHKAAVDYYKVRLAQFVRKNISTQNKTLTGAYVPSHEAGKDSAGLNALLGYLGEQFGFGFSVNPLERKTTVNKLADGGRREKDVHLGSIVVRKKSVAIGCTVLLLDDVTTSGNSMWACEELLHREGAQLVVKIALAKTEHD